MTPISFLEPVTLVEGQLFGPVATCSSVGKPQAGLSWDTDLPGQSQNRSLEGGISLIQFSLHPLRSMNGRKLDCLVWHPTLKIPRRHSNQLVVHCESGWSCYLHISSYYTSLRWKSTSLFSSEDELVQGGPIEETLLI